MNPVQAHPVHPSARPRHRFSQAQDRLLCGFARCILFILGRVPFSLAASLGRAGGQVFYWIDAKHRKVALRNLQRCFSGEKSRAEIKQLARENFRRIGENFACSFKCSVSDLHSLQERVELVLPPGFNAASRAGGARSRILAFGHFGNFEVLSRIPQFLPAYRGVGTYRGLRHPALDRLLLSLRSASGCKLFERRTESAAFKRALRSPGILFGLAADQHAGTGAVQVPFLNQHCSTSKAPAVFAKRFRHPLHAAICYRISKARWRVEVTEEIPTRVGGTARSSEAIMQDINGAFERAIRLDPANWFWVHNRWKSSGIKKINPFSHAAG